MAGLVDALCRHRGKQLSCVDAAQELGMSERHFRRLRDAYAIEGAEGLVDHRRGRISGRRASSEEIAFVTSEFRSRYFDFTASHFHEALRGKPMANGAPFARSYSWTKSVLQWRGLTTKAKRRGAHRRKRERRPLPGMMVFQDGSTHAWLQGKPALDLIVTMDDATSRILSIFLVAQEGTASSFRGLAEAIGGHGLFSSFYTDRGSHYFYTPKAREKVDKIQLTQVGRALGQLRIEHIPSYTPQGRGRMERVWQTLQGRLPPLLRQAGISDIAGANGWLAQVYIAAHNARFAVEPAEEGTAFIPFAGALDDILCIEEERVVGQDNTVRYENRVLQIPESRHRNHFVKVKVRVREYGDGSLAIFHGPRKIAAFDKNGALKEEPAKTKFAA
jgi:hypothetical protein